MAFLGILAFGGVFAGSNPSHTTYELSHAFKVAQVRAVIVEPELLSKALKAAQENDIPSSRIFVFDHHTPVSELSAHSLEDSSWDGLRSWRRLLGHGDSDWV